MREVKAVSERFTHARILLDATESGDGVDRDVDQAWDEEIGRRIASVQDGSAKFKDAEEVFAELEALVAAGWESGGFEPWSAEMKERMLQSAHSNQPLIGTDEH